MLGDLLVGLLCDYLNEAKHIAWDDVRNADVNCLFGLSRALGAAGFMLPVEEAADSQVEDAGSALCGGDWPDGVEWEDSYSDFCDDADWWKE